MTTPKQPQNQTLNWEKVTAIAAVLTAVAAFLAICAALAVPFIDDALQQDERNTGDSVVSDGVETPTDTPTNPAPSILPTIVTIATATSRPNTPIILTIQRSGDSLAICSDQIFDWAMVRLDLGNNLRYELSALVEDPNALCQCLQKNEGRFPISDACNARNTIRIGREEDDWRNANLQLFYAGDVLDEECPAQSNNLEVYDCPILSISPNP